MSTCPRGVSGDNERMPSVLVTERLVLRPFTDHDVDLLVELDSDPSVMRFITGGLATPRCEIEEEVLPAFLRHYTRWPGWGWGFFATEERVSGTFLGWFHLRPGDGDPDDEVELGYRLRQDAWGKGYATEGARALIDYAFGQGARRVYATTMVANVASRRVLEKAGLRFVRTFTQPWPYRIEGEEKGDVEYALLRNEWETSPGRIVN
jgi:RimJ/RimL family protein N-acetyltransferase